MQFTPLKQLTQITPVIMDNQTSDIQNVDSQDVGQHTDAATQDSAESSSCAGDNDPVIRLGMSTNTLYQSVSQIRLSLFFSFLAVIFHNIDKV